jgi:hypothetical protein
MRIYAMSTRLLCVLLIGFSTSLMSAADKPDGNIRVHVLRFVQESAPLNILGWRGTNDMLHGPKILVRNDSNVAIVSFALAIGSVIPKTCAASGNDDHWNVESSKPMEQVVLKPGQTIESTSDLLMPVNLVDLATVLNSRDYDVRIYVTKVAFSDGTSWMSPGLRTLEKTNDCSGRDAFILNPLSEIHLQLSSAQASSSTMKRSEEIVTEWTLECKTTGTKAHCE